MKKEIVCENAGNQRIDNFLAKELLGYSRSYIQKAIKNGGILLNNHKAKPGQILKNGDKINIHIPPIRPYQMLPNNNITLRIIFEDDDILVVNKPAGLQTHPGVWQEQDTLANALLARYPEIKNIGEDSLRPGLVHRLDKDTSGLMIIAKNQKFFHHLKDQFQNRKVKKIYLCLVRGLMKKDQGFVNRPIGRSASKPIRQTTGKSRNQREALTEFKVLTRFKDYTLIQALPKTGRTHQIRVHMASIGHPIVGDKTYGNKKVQPIKRQFLHASELKINAPNGKKMAFQSPLPDELKSLLKILEK